MKSLKSTVICKVVNEDLVLAMNLAEEEDCFYRFEGVSSFFLRRLSEKVPEEQILRGAMEEFSGCTQAQVKRDLQKLLKRLQSIGFIA